MPEATQAERPKAPKPAAHDSEPRPGPTAVTAPPVEDFIVRYGLNDEGWDFAPATR